MDILNRIIPILITLFAGYLLARTVERVALRFVRMRNAREATGPDRSPSGAAEDSERPTRVVFWAVMIVTVLVAADMLR